MKGYVLQLLQKAEMWDYEVVEAVMAEYGVSGEYWFGTVRLTLTDLYSGGLLNEVTTTVDPDKSFGQEKVLVKYALNDFGRTRMEQSGLTGAHP